MHTDEELLAQAQTAGYELVEGRYHGRAAWKWQGSWPNPFFFDRAVALRRVEYCLGRCSLTWPVVRPPSRSVVELLARRVALPSGT